MRLPTTIITVAALSAFLLPATATAQDELPACAEGYVAVESVGGPLCVGAVYLDGTWNDDPRDCLFGYYQGSCAPEPQPPTVLPEEAYEFQMTPEAKAAWTPAPMWTPPARAAEPAPMVVVSPVAWLSPVELERADARFGPR